MVWGSVYQKGGGRPGRELLCDVIPFWARGNGRNCIEMCQRDSIRVTSCVSPQFLCPPLSLFCVCLVGCCMNLSEKGCEGLLLLLRSDSASKRIGRERKKEKKE